MFEIVSPEPNKYPKKIIDKERNYEFIHVRYGRESYAVFYLLYNGKKIPVLAERSLDKNQFNEHFVKWNVINITSVVGDNEIIYYKYSSKYEISEVIILVGEALKVFGFNYNGHAEKLVEVDFSNLRRVEL